MTTPRGGDVGGAMPAGGSAGGEGVAGPAPVGDGPPVGDDGQGMQEDGAAMGPMLEALLACMANELADEVTGTNNLCLVSSCSPRVARRKAAELYSPPGATRELGRFPNLSVETVTRCHDELC